MRVWNHAILPLTAYFQHVGSGHVDRVVGFELDEWLGSLIRGEVHIWIACDEDIFDSALLAKYNSVLSMEEREKMGRFKFPKDRQRYLVAHALLRYVLSVYRPTVLPAQWQFKSGPYGKPLVYIPRTDLCFSLSHTFGLVAVAVAIDCDLGLDVESLRSDIDINIATSLFSRQESASLFALPEGERLERFVDLWTLKEAYVKAIGMGLFMPLNSFSFHFLEDASVCFEMAQGDPGSASGWWFWRHDINGRHKLALACQRPAGERKCVVKTFGVIPGRAFELLPMTY